MASNEDISASAFQKYKIEKYFQGSPRIEQVQHKITRDEVCGGIAPHRTPEPPQCAGGEIQFHCARRVSHHDEEGVVGEQLLGLPTRGSTWTMQLYPASSTLRRF